MIGPETAVATYGSCFAQHFSRALTRRGYNWLQCEEAPHGMSDSTRRRYGYGLFSSRTGNIYTPTLLEQWGEWAFSNKPVPDEFCESEGRFYDLFRPAIEPQGFADLDELMTARKRAVDAFRESVLRAEVFVFTLGLTERWLNRRHGYEYPICPGVRAGTFDPGIHRFANLRAQEVVESMRRVTEMFRGQNARLKFLLTVSPVPLTATASGRHVQVATMDSKATLRAAAGKLSESRRFVDYFPSFELIFDPYRDGTWFEPNRRSVSNEGVEMVMKSFFLAQSAAFDLPVPELDEEPNNADVVCEEELVGSFAPGATAVLPEAPEPVEGALAASLIAQAPGRARAPGGPVRICVIGSSHCASINDAWMELQDRYPGFDLTFFAAPGKGALMTQVVGRRLAPTSEATASFFQMTSGQEGGPEIDSYDRFLLYGLTIQPEVDQDDSCFSDAAVEAAVFDRLTYNSAREIAARLRTHSDRPIDIAFSPFPSPLPGVTVPDNPGRREAENTYFEERLAVSLGVTFLAQPDSLILQGRSTPPEFSTGSRRLRPNRRGRVLLHGDDDNRHMNLNYGRAWLSWFLDRPFASADAATAEKHDSTTPEVGTE